MEVEWISFGWDFCSFLLIFWVTFLKFDLTNIIWFVDLYLVFLFSSTEYFFTRSSYTTISKVALISQGLPNSKFEVYYRECLLFWILVVRELDHSWCSYSFRSLFFLFIWHSCYTHLAKYFHYFLAQFQHFNY